MLRKTQHEVEVNSVTTHTSIIVTKVEKNYKKDVATLKLLLRQNK